ncbi:MAG: polysaccharide biosynthesis protein [Dactylosporangium sp.]|nr:polysaccharide biosynthesis protein [Dactylosporangium sp.]NNJ60660.1 polysaccharide biosynthesis protein [Dactylosporangium sp.]
MVIQADPSPLLARGPRTVRRATVDGLAWAGSLLLAAWVRYDFALSGAQIRAVLVATVVAVVVHNGLGHPLFLYRGRYAFGAFEEVRTVSSAAALTTAALFVGNLVPASRPLPASVPLTGGVLALVGMLAVRYLRRLYLERTMRPSPSATVPVLVFGAGGGATALLRAMLLDPRGKYLPVGLLDDDPAKQHLRVNGVPVLGGRSELRELIERTAAAVVIFAIPTAPPALVREIRQVVESTGSAFKVLPSMIKMLDRPVAVSDIRDVSILDLLGRGQVQTDLDAIAGYLTGKRVLVTGAGGSIGSELCRQLHRLRPAELIMLDRDESALHAAQLSIFGRALLDDPGVVLADLRDEPRLRQIFADRRPQVVFHAAALKHQPLLEQYPAEAVKTNVWGTATVLEASAATGVEVLVNISTDKAADPCSVLGYSKRAAERLTAHAAHRVPGRYLSVRFGNVLGSRGSVLTAFTAQLAAGGPLTVTDPRITRYFMTVEEAVQLVIQAGAVGGPGEALVLDMGDPVPIADLARQMASLSSEPVDIVYTGLRPGEKLHERLFGTDERDERPWHPLISHVVVPELDPALARTVDPRAGYDVVVHQLISLCAAARPATPVCGEAQPPGPVDTRFPRSVARTYRPGPAVSAANERVTP